MRIKRFTAILLALIMCISTSNATVFAKEIEKKSVLAEQNENELKVNTDGVMMMANIDDTFNIHGFHRGSTRSYYQNSLSFNITMTNQSGQVLTDGTILAIRLVDASTGYTREWQTSSYGYSVNNIPITYGGRYYFEYVVAYGTQNLKLRMRIS